MYIYTRVVWYVICPPQVTLDTLLSKSDVITLHTPGGKDTKNLLGAAALAKCKQGVFLVNAGRGGVVNEADLLAALESGKVGAWGSDGWA
jgi:phosphoglycerate dehydrogenase-like enzyme